MKLDALDHPKTNHFASLLGISRPTAIGHLELLWAFTGKMAPQGNLGKWPDGAITRACDWMGDPSVFLEALLEARLLDANEEHRLLVHDWHVHAAGWVRAKLKHGNLRFLTGASTSEAIKDGSRDQTRGPTRDPTIQGKGNEGKGREAYEARASSSSDQVSIPETNGNARHELTEQIQAIYPAGTYRQSNWILAERALSKLLDAGESADDLVAHTRAFAEQQASKGSTGTQFVLSPEKFFGPEGHWRGPFPLPAGKPGAGPTMDELRARYAPEVASG